MTTTVADPAAATLFDEVVELRASVRAEAARICDRWAPFVHRRRYAPSAANLAAYLALRRRDLRALQADLMPLGLSSLGRCESRVLPNLDAVIAALAAQVGRDGGTPPTAHAFFRGGRFLRAHTAQVFGPPAPRRDVRIMVTLDGECAVDPAFVRALVAAGMDCARINCAHDEPATWETMIRNVRDASDRLGRPCSIHVDLPGPKVRTKKVRMLAERVRTGDAILLAEHVHDHVPEADDVAAVVTCTLHEVRERVRDGHALWIDDGKIGTRVVRAGGGEPVLLRVTSAPAKGATIKCDKGINVPQTDLGLPSLARASRRARSSPTRRWPNAPTA